MRGLRSRKPIGFRQWVVHYNGKIQNIKEWAEELGIKDKTLRGRLNRGWSVERALETK